MGLWPTFGCVISPIRNALVMVAIVLCGGAARSFGAPDNVPAYFRSDAGLQTGTGPLPDRLEDAGALTWRVALDSGHSTPVIRAGKIFLTTYRADTKELAVVALDEKSGQQLWQRPIRPRQVEQTHPIGNPATATPACAGQRLFVFFGS